MAVIQHRQIADMLKHQYVPQLDLSDIRETRTAEREAHSLSRALASFVLYYVAQIDTASAIAANTDSGGDNGLDAIYYDANEKNLILVQSKWNTVHTGSIDTSGVLKFVRGVKDLLNSRKSRFSKKITDRWKEIEAAINQARRVTLVITYSGSGSFAQECQQILQDAVVELDESGEMIKPIIVSQSQIHGIIVEGAAGNPVAVEAKLFEWGHTSDPLKAYYGQIAASDLVDFHKKFGERIFSKNIRFFLGEKSEVNSGIQASVHENPELFWYMNNGVTALCATIIKKLIGGGSRDSAVFVCEGFSIVNGAQTVGSLAALHERYPENLRVARVPIRIISLEAAPEGFSSQITRTNNTQNKIDSRNFVALDPQQERLRAEFAVDKIDYEYRQGEIENQGPARLGLVEATIALACTHPSVDLAVQAKREIGKLWDDISRAPYKLLFNSGVTSDEIWKRVLAFRRIDATLSGLEFKLPGKTSHAITHGNRLLANVIYRELRQLGHVDDLSDLKDSEIETAGLLIVTQLMAILDTHYGDNYVASLFKNASKCKDIAGRIRLEEKIK